MRPLVKYRCASCGRRWWEEYGHPAVDLPEVTIRVPPGLAGCCTQATGPTGYAEWMDLQADARRGLL